MKKLTIVRVLLNLMNGLTQEDIDFLQGKYDIDYEGDKDYGKKGNGKTD